MPTISLCMIVHNEAATLTKAVQSALPLVDEVVIGVDTACSDDTPQIARELASAGKCFDFQWQNNFSAARNLAIEQATQEWIFILDGHECVAADDHPVLWQMARMRGLNPDETPLPTSLAALSNLRHDGMPEGFDVACLTLAMNCDPAGIPQLFFLQPRLFRRNDQIRYTNAVHNALSGYRNDGAMAVPEAILLHDMPPQREAQRKRQRAHMNLQGLMSDVRRERQKPKGEQDGRPFFYLGNSYADMGRHAQALHWYLQYLPRSKFGEEKYQALQQTAILCHRHRHDVQLAKRYALDALMMQWRRAEPCILLAEIAIEDHDPEQALHWLKLAEQYRAPHTVMFLQGPVYSYLPALQAAKCHVELQDWNQAIRCLQEALTWRPGDPSVLQLQDEIRSHMRKDSADKNVLIVDKLGSFSGDLGQHLANKHYTVIRRQAINNQWKGWADLAWFEWCDENLIEASKEPWQCPVICRLHSYEAFSDLPPHVNWGNVNHLVFVAPHIMELFKQRWPQVQVPMSVIPNGINAESLTYRQRQHGRRIGFLGYLNHKKGVETLVQAIRVLSDYEFHVAGQFQDPHLAYYWEHAIRDLPNVWFHGWIEPQRKDEWLEGVDYLISPSIVESFGYSIAEAMVKGIFPILHQRPGAIYPQHTFRSVNDIRAVLEKPYDSEAYRRHILEHYSLERQMRATEALIDTLWKTRQRATPAVVYPQGPQIALNTD